jgi:hypothetical protein
MKGRIYVDPRVCEVLEKRGVSSVHYTTLWSGAGTIIDEQGVARQAAAYVSVDAVLHLLEAAHAAPEVIAVVESLQ